MFGALSLSFLGNQASTGSMFLRPANLVVTMIRATALNAEPTVWCFGPRLLRARLPALRAPPPAALSSRR